MILDTHLLAPLIFTPSRCLRLCFKHTTSPSHTRTSRALSSLCSSSMATSCGRTLMEALHPETTITFHIFRHDTFISRLLSGEQVGGNHIDRLLNDHIDIGAGCINCFMERWFNTGRLQFWPSPFSSGAHGCREAPPPQFWPNNPCNYNQQRIISVAIWPSFNEIWIFSLKIERLDFFF